MPTHLYQRCKVYFFPLILLTAVLTGALTGYLWGPGAMTLKPLGDIFLNLMFTVVIPLVFFSISAVVASMGELKRIWKVISTMLMVFIFTGTVAAIFMLIVVKLFPPAQDVVFHLPVADKPEAISIGDQLTHIFTVSDFPQLFSRQNILALIFFAILIGLSTAAAGEKGQTFAKFLRAGSEISMKAVSFVMYYAPIGFFAYFAVLVVELGPKIIETYMHATWVYYSASVVYFIVAFSAYAYLAGKKPAVRAFWKNVFLPLTTSLATCSSAASIPVNLQATERMGVPKDISETVVPLGAIIHKDGSVLGGIVKIAFLFGVFHLSFSGPMVFLTAILIALLVGTVMGAIPSGGMVAEVLILSLYDLPPQALIMVAAITIIIDPPATALNVNGDSVAGMLVARWVEGKRWLIKG